MANSSDLRRSASAGLTPFMVKHGFTQIDGCCYYRIVGDGVLQSVIVVPVKGTHGRVWVTCTVPELLGHGYTPGGNIRSKNIGIDSGGMLGKEGVEEGDSLFPEIDSLEKREEFMAELPALIEKWAIPYFEKLSSRESLWREMEIHGKNEFHRKAVLGQ